MVQCRVERLLKGDAFCYKAVLNEAAAGDRVAQHGVYFVEGQSVLHTGAKGFFVVVIKVDAAALGGVGFGPGMQRLFEVCAGIRELPCVIRYAYIAVGQTALDDHAFAAFLPGILLPFMTP